METIQTKSELNPLTAQREKLFDQFIKGRQADFLTEHTLILDNYFHHSFASSQVGPKLGLSNHPYALIALGGYGRQEQCIHSDIDLLFLFQKRVPQKAEDLVREIIYPLWDMGIEVGHATRSVKECLSAAREDYEILTAMLDARFLCGMSPLYSELKQRLRSSILKSRSPRIISWLVDTNTARHHRFGDSAYLLKPNLKEGQGGLRDYHTIRWVAIIKSNLQTRRDLEYYGYLSHDQYKSVSDSLAFIWRVRNYLHHLAGRKCDQLHYEYQKKLAAALGYQAGNGQQAVERFLGDLHARMELIKQQHLVFLYELEFKKKRRGRKRRKTLVNFDGLEVRDGMLGFKAPEDILRAPELLMVIFQESTRLQMPLSVEAKQLIRDLTYLVDDPFRTSPAVVKSFERILVSQAPTFNVLNEMLNTGMLMAFIPEFKWIANRILYDQYHIYPVDKHSLRVVRTLKNFGTKEDDTHCLLCAELYGELSQRKLLLWGALLHDIGKGRPGSGHSQKGAALVHQIKALEHLKPKDRETVAFLVGEHLRLVKTATRRDIQDEETAIVCAREIKDPERLKMLYLLTVADSFATGPKAWNEWTATLLRDLFLKVANIFEKGELASKKAVKTVVRKEEALLSSAGDPNQRRQFETLFRTMSPRYLLATPVENIRTHALLYGQKGTDAFVWKVEKTPASNTRTVTICAADRPGLISNIAGVFTLNGIDILDVQVFTWRNNTALDVFTVHPPPDRIFEDEKWAKAEADLRAALSGEMSLSKVLKEKVALCRSNTTQLSEKPTQIIVDNDSSSFYTIIEVHTYDFPGLLHAITHVLFKCRLDIWVAKIATNVEQVVDVFYVRDIDGQKIDAETEATLKAEIGIVLSNCL